MVPLLIGFAGVLLGGAALYFSLTGSGQTESAQSKLETINAKAEGLETRVRDLEAKFQTLDSDLKALQGRTSQIENEINREFKEVASEINRNRDLIETSADKLTELINTLNRDGRPTTSRPAPSAPSAPSTQPSAPSAPTDPMERLPLATTDEPDDLTDDPVSFGSETRSHTIRSGDTFTKLSQQYNVSVAAILAANPDVDPRRLAVGQKIKIPASD